MLHSEVNQLWYTCTLLFEPPSLLHRIHPGPHRALSWALCSTAAPCERPVSHIAVCMGPNATLSASLPLLSRCNVGAIKGPRETFATFGITQKHAAEKQPWWTGLGATLPMLSLGASKCSHLGDSALKQDWVGPVGKGNCARKVGKRRRCGALTVACSWEDQFRSNLWNVWGLKLTILRLK